MNANLKTSRDRCRPSLIRRLRRLRQFQWSPFWFGSLLLGSILLWSLSSAAPMQAQQTDQQERPALSDEQIQTMVNNLAADQFAARQNAMRDLIRSGAQVLDSLQVAIHGGDPESQMRAIQVVGKLAIDRDPECQRVAQDLLAELSSSENADIRNLAKKTIDDLGEAMVDRAVAELQSLGATIDVSQYMDGNRIISSYAVTIAPSFKGDVDDYRMLTWLNGQTSLTLIGEQINDQVIEQMRDMNQVYSLIIKRGTITNESLPTIAQFAALSTLHFYYVNIDNEGLEILTDMKHLSELRLVGTRVTRQKGQWAQKFMESTDVDCRNGAFLGIYFNDSETGPCIVNNIVEGSAADNSGFRAGDRIMEFQGKEVTTGSVFIDLVANCFPGDKVKAVVQRGDEKLNLELELGRFPDVEEFKE